MKKINREEILRRIEEIENFIEADQELGCGFSPDGAYDSLYKEKNALRKQLKNLY